MIDMCSQLLMFKLIYNLLNNNVRAILLQMLKLAGCTVFWKFVTVPQMIQPYENLGSAVVIYIVRQ